MGKKEYIDSKGKKSTPQQKMACSIGIKRLDKSLTKKDIRWICSKDGRKIRH